VSDWLVSSFAAKDWDEVRGRGRLWWTQVEHETKACPCRKEAKHILCCISSMVIANRLRQR